MDPEQQEPTARRWTRGRRAAVAVGTVAGLTVASVVLAGLTATTTSPVPQPVDGGELVLTLDDVGTGFSTAVTDLAPGDVVLRHVRLDSTGSLDGADLTLTVTSSGDAALVTDGASTRALTLAVNGCDVAWDAGTGTCAGTASTLLAATTVGLLTTPVALVDELLAGASLHLQLVLALPDQDETTVDGAPPAETVQGATVALTYGFTMVQRDPLTTTG